MKLYLLEENPEAVEMRAKIKNMLLSKEANNILLALQLMEGGGFPAEIVPYIWVMACMDTPPIHLKKIKTILKKNTTASMYVLFQDTLEIYSRKYENTIWDEDFQEWASITLNMLQEDHQTSPYLRDFALAFLHFTSYGGGYVMRHAILPEETICRALIDNQELSLAYFKLTALPACLGEFTALEKLNIEGNLLLDIPDNLKNLKNLKSLRFEDGQDEYKPLPAVLQKLEDFFPLLLADHYKQKGWQATDSSEYENSITFYEKSLTLDGENDIVWNNLAWAYSHVQKYEKAFEASEKAILFAKTLSDKASYTSNKASDEQRVGFSEKSKQTAQEVRDMLRTVPENQWLREDLFSYALACQIGGKYEEALVYYEKYEQSFSYVMDGALYYNKACVYANLGQKENVVEMLKKAIQTDNIDWVQEARQDTDFERYWHDAFFEELQKEFDEKLPF